MPIIKTLEPHPKLVSIRKAYFAREFWKGWKELDTANKEIYLLGWLAKIEHTLTLPFPVKGLTLVPKEALRRIDESLEEIRQEFDAEVEIFISKYEDERLEAREILGDLFNDSDYPVDIRSKFHFEWQFLTLDVPGKSRILPVEVYEREVQKFQAMMEEARELAVAALREEFAGIVAHIGDRLSGKDDGKAKRFRFSMVERLREFVESFSDRNLFQDELLEGLVEQARNLLNGVSSVNLRKDEGLRDMVGVEMGLIKLAIDEAMEDLPRRKIRLAA
jgi:hypothetical protein